MIRVPQRRPFQRRPLLLLIPVLVLAACGPRGADDRAPGATVANGTRVETDQMPAPVEPPVSLPSRAASVPARGVDAAVSGVLALVPALPGTRMITAGPVQSGPLVVTGDVAGALRARPTDPAGGGWRRRLAGAVSGLAVDETSLYVATAATLARLDPADGAELWRASLPGRAVTEPIAGARLYVATEEGSVVALSVEDGSLAWRVDVGAPVTDRLILADGVLYATTPDALVAIGASDGVEIWRHRARVTDEGEPERFAAAPAPADGRVVLASVGGGVVTLDGSGREVDSWRLDAAPVIASPIVVGQTIVVVDGEGAIHATDLAGTPRWRATVGTHPSAQPAQVGRVLVVAGVDGGVVALDASSGDELSRIALASAAVGEAAYLDGRLLWRLANGSVQPIGVDAPGTDAPLLAGDEPHRLPPEGRFRLRDDSVELRMRSEEDAVFEITAVATPPEDLILRVQDDAGNDVATNMGKVTLEPIVRTALDAGRSYLLIVERPDPRSAEVTVSLTTEQVR